MTSRRLFRVTVVVVAAMFIAVAGDANQAQFYVLDGFGGVHAGGGAPIITPGTPYFGFDIARDIAYIAGDTGGGYLVLDGFGGIHQGGGVFGAISPLTPYFGFDIARAIAYRSIPPRVSTTSSAAYGDITDLLVHSIASTTIFAPDDGYVIVLANAQFNCPNLQTGGVGAFIGLSVDTSSSIDPDFGGMSVGIRDCDNLVLGGQGFPSENIMLHKAYFISVGAHTVHFLVQKWPVSNPDTLRYWSPKLTAIFIDHDSLGGSSPYASAAPGRSGALVGDGS